MARIKKAARLLVVCLLGASLCGCWDYRSLNSLTIVTGITIDKEEGADAPFQMGFEIVDLNSGGSGTRLASTMLETQGRTLTEAVNNASRKFHNDMYFGNTEIVVVGETLAKELELRAVIDPLIRDAMLRDNLTVLISREETAKAILTPPEGESSIVSFNLNDAIGAPQRANSMNSTNVQELDQVYATLVREADLVLPVVRFADEEKKTLRLDGMALFHDEKLCGYLDEQQMPFYVLASSRLKSGSLNLFMESEQEGDSLYVGLVDRQSKPKLSYRFDGTRFTLAVDLKTQLSAVEFSPNLRGKTTLQTVEQIEDRAQEMINGQIVHMLETVQQDSGVDVLDFGGTVRNKDPKLWDQVQENWDDWYRDANFEVKSQVTLRDTGLMKNF